MTDTWSPALRCRCRFRNRFRENRVRTCRSVRSQTPGAPPTLLRGKHGGQPLGPAVLLPRTRPSNGTRNGKIELDPIGTDARQRRTYGNGEHYFYVGLS